MKVIAFIEPTQGGLIENILRHCGLWRPSAPRPPPVVDWGLFASDPWPDADFADGPPESFDDCDTPPDWYVDLDPFEATF